MKPKPQMSRIYPHGEEKNLYIYDGHVEWTNYGYMAKPNDYNDRYFPFASDLQSSILPGPYRVWMAHDTVVRIEPIGNPDGTEHKRAYRSTIMGLMKITDNDIAANHHGKLGPKQKRIVLIQNFRRLLLGLGCLGLGLMMLIYSIPGFFSEEIGISTIVGGLIMGAIWLAIFGVGVYYTITSLTDVVGTKVEQICGQIFLSSRYSQKGGTTYELTMDGKSYEAGHLARMGTFNFIQACTNGREHRVFMTSRAHVIVGIEPL